MLQVHLYEYIILFVVTVLCCEQAQRYKNGTFNLTVANYTISDGIGLFLCIALTLLIGLRPLEHGMANQWGDTSNYYSGYLLREGGIFELDTTPYEYIWNNLFNFFAANSFGLTPLFVICDAIYFGCTYAACRKWFPHDSLAAFLVFLSAFSTYSYSFNGVRAGVAAALFVLALAYYDRKLLSIFLIFCSYGFHHSMQVPIAAYVLTLFYKNPKWYFYGWAFCVLMAILHVGFFQNLFMGYTDESGAGYLKGSTSEDVILDQGGFRPDFLLYSAMPVLIGYKIVMKEKLKVSKLYSSLLHIYLCTNGIWCLCMYAGFSNRIAYLSWFLYPFVLIYPFLKEDLRNTLFLGTRNQYAMFAKVMMYHLYFTLFMELVYYKL